MNRIIPAVIVCACTIVALAGGCHRKVKDEYHRLWDEDPVFASRLEALDHLELDPRPIAGYLRQNIGRLDRFRRLLVWSTHQKDPSGPEWRMAWVFWKWGDYSNAWYFAKEAATKRMTPDWLNLAMDLSVVCTNGELLAMMNSEEKESLGKVYDLVMLMSQQQYERAAQLLRALDEAEWNNPEIYSVKLRVLRTLKQCDVIDREMELGPEQTIEPIIERITAQKERPVDLDVARYLVSYALVAYEEGSPCAGSEQSRIARARAIRLLDAEGTLPGKVWRESFARPRLQVKESLEGSMTRAGR